MTVIMKIIKLRFRASAWASQRQTKGRCSGGRSAQARRLSAEDGAAQTALQPRKQHSPPSPAAALQQHQANASHTQAPSLNCHDPGLRVWLLSPPDKGGNDLEGSGCLPQVTALCVLSGGRGDSHLCRRRRSPWRGCRGGRGDRLSCRLFPE